MKALIVVDIQNDFCSGGALEVKDAEQIVELVNRLIKRFESDGMPVVFTRDWHPVNHISFIENGGIWPVHCVAGSVGAEFHPDLYFPSVSILVSKANTAEDEAYSGFQGTGLFSNLRDLGIEELIVVGLATDYCVKNTVLDALKLGFSVDVVKEAVKAVNIDSNDEIISLNEMKKHGARVIEIDDVV